MTVLIYATFYICGGIIGFAWGYNKAKEKLKK